MNKTSGSVAFNRIVAVSCSGAGKDWARGKGGKGPGEALRSREAKRQLAFGRRQHKAGKAPAPAAPQTLKLVSLGNGAMQAVIAEMIREGRVAELDRVLGCLSAEALKVEAKRPVRSLLWQALETGNEEVVVSVIAAMIGHGHAFAKAQIEIIERGLDRQVVLRRGPVSAAFLSAMGRGWGKTSTRHVTSIVQALSGRFDFPPKAKDPEQALRTLRHAQPAAEAKFLMAALRDVGQAQAEKGEQAMPAAKRRGRL